MAQFADITAILEVALGVGCALAGVWAWRRDGATRAFWLAWRAVQLGATALAAVAIAAFVSGFDPAEGLFWLYLLLPIAISIIAEQLRLASAQLVLDQHGLEDAQAVGRLPEAEQRWIVAAIMRRETAVAAIAALVIAFLALRILGTT